MVQRAGREMNYAVGLGVVPEVRISLYDLMSIHEGVRMRDTEC